MTIIIAFNNKDKTSYICKGLIAWKEDVHIIERNKDPRHKPWEIKFRCRMLLISPHVKRTLHCIYSRALY